MPKPTIYTGKYGSYFTRVGGSYQGLPYWSVYKVTSTGHKKLGGELVNKAAGQRYAQICAHQGE